MKSAAHALSGIVIVMLSVRTLAACGEPTDLQVAELASLAKEPAPEGSCDAVCVCAGTDCPEPPAEVDCSSCFLDDKQEWPKGPWILTPTAQKDPESNGADVPRNPANMLPPPRDTGPAAAACHALENLKDCLMCCDSCTEDAVDCQEGCTYDPSDPLGPTLVPTKPSSECITDPDCWHDAIEGWLGLGSYDVCGAEL